MSKRVLLILLPVIIGVSIVGGIYFSVKPSVQNWMLKKINSLAQEKLPVQLSIEEVNWKLLWPGISLSGVSISEKPGGIKNIPETRIEKVSASLDLLAILGGKISISSLLIEELESEMDIDPLLVSEGPSKPLPINDIFLY